MKIGLVSLGCPKNLVDSEVMLGLAEQGDAPRALTRVNGRGVPVAGLAVSAAAPALCVVVNYVMPGEAFELLMMLVVAALVINWGMISLTHLRFRRHLASTGRAPAFRSPAAPYTNYLCLAFMAAILVVMSLTPGMWLAVLIAPAWVAVLAGFYWLRVKSRRALD